MRQDFCLTPVPDLRRMAGCGGLPTNVGGVRGTILNRGRVSRVLVPTPLAQRLLVSEVWERQSLAASCDSAAVCALRLSGFGDCGDRVSGHAQATDDVVPRHVVRNQPKNGGSALGLQRVLGLNTYETAWGWLHKLRRAMVRPGRDGLSGWVEVDETYLGGLEEGAAGRRHMDKALIVIAAQADGKRIGRIRMRAIQDASAASLHPFVKDCVAPASTVHTDGWQGYQGLDQIGYDHEVTVLRGNRKDAGKLLPRVHLVASLLKRWLLGTHQGAVSHAHLPYYLDEFTFRFNRRTSRSRGKLFFDWYNRLWPPILLPTTLWFTAFAVWQPNDTF